MIRLTAVSLLLCAATAVAVNSIGALVEELPEDNWTLVSTKVSTSQCKAACKATCSACCKKNKKNMATCKATMKSCNAACSSAPQSHMASLLQQHAQVGARAKYDMAMARMKKLANKYGQMEKVYQAKAEQAGRKELRAEKRERDEAHLKAQRYPVLHLEDKTGEFRPSVEKALQHKEVDAMIDEVTQEHKAEQASGDPLAPLKRAQKEFAEETAKDVEMATKWEALQYGSKRLIPRAVDEADVLAEANKIDAEQEAKLGHPLSAAQKKKILEATRVYEKNKMDIDLVKKRIASAHKLAVEDSLEVKKQLAHNQAERMMDAQDAAQAKMKQQVAEVQAEANAAIVQETQEATTAW